jgi:hypothetical protein
VGQNGLRSQEIIQVQFTGKFPEKFTEKFPEKFPEKFTENETQRKIVRMMLPNPKVSRDSKLKSSIGANQVTTFSATNIFGMAADAKPRASPISVAAMGVFAPAPLPGGHQGSKF